MKAFSSLVLFLATALTALGQGTIYFANRVNAPDGTRLVNAPVYDLTGIPVMGPAYMAQLFYTTSLDPKLGDLVLVGDPVPFQAGGYWLPATRVIPGISPGASATVGAFAWNTANGTIFAEAAASGTYGGSSLIQVVLGGDGMPAANMIVLRPFEIIPEPSSVGLLGLGFAGLFLGRALRR